VDDPPTRESHDEGFKDFVESILQHIDEAFFWCDPNTVIPYYVTNAFERIWGRSCQSIYENPSSWIESIHPDDRARVTREFEDASDGGRNEMQYRIVRPDGEVRWICTRTFPLWSQDGQIRRLIGIAQDCTERRRSEEMRAFLAAIVESSEDSIIGTDLHGRIRTWNRGAERLFGYTTEEAVGESIRLIFLPDRQADHLATLHKIRRLEHIEHFESVRVGKNGVPIDVAVIISPIRDSLGELQGVSGIYRDITDRKRAEREKSALELRLRHVQKLESMGRLAAGIAHEINTPIQYVGDNLLFLKDACAKLALALQNQGAAPAETRTALPGTTGLAYLLQEVPLAIDQSLEGIDRVATLVRAMKEFSHPGKPERTLIDLNNAIANTITVARNEWKYVATLESDYDHSLPLVPCFPSDLNQVILNLIVNAAQAIAEKTRGQTLGKISVRTKRRASDAEILVQDDGAGIPENVRDRVFEPFFTTKDVGRGTGQGLAIAHAIIVDKHGGEIGFETETGAGTKFLIRIPLAAAQDAQATLEPPT
jgi:PAS domain S-box-containing protein